MSENSRSGKSEPNDLDSINVEFEFCQNIDEPYEIVAKYHLGSK